MSVFPLFASPRPETTTVFQLSLPGSRHTPKLLITSGLRQCTIVVQRAGSRELSTISGQHHLLFHGLFHKSGGRTVGWPTTLGLEGG